jgi:hypothetical protein
MYIAIHIQTIAGAKEDLNFRTKCYLNWPETHFRFKTVSTKTKFVLFKTVVNFWKVFFSKR